MCFTRPLPILGLTPAIRSEIRTAARRYLRAYRRLHGQVRPGILAAAFEDFRAVDAIDGLEEAIFGLNADAREIEDELDYRDFIRDAQAFARRNFA